MMAFTNGLSERMGELRFPNPKSPNDEVPFSGYASPPRGQNSFFSPFQPSTSTSSDIRGSLQRRFTTDSSKMSSLSSLGGQNSQMVKPHFTASVRGAHFTQFILKAEFSVVLWSSAKGTLLSRPRTAWAVVTATRGVS